MSRGDDIDDENNESYDKKYSGGAISNNGHDPRRAFRNCKKVRIFLSFQNTTEINSKWSKAENI